MIAILVSVQLIEILWERQRLGVRSQQAAKPQWERAIAGKWESEEAENY